MAKLTRFILFFLSCFLLSFQIEAGTIPQVFAKYPNKYFIETGSYMGGGIKMALDVGFSRVYSVELAPYYHKYCCDLFVDCPNVTILLGDSTYVLPKILEEIDAPATFWLDGHYSCFTGCGKGETNSPILLELEVIGKHHIKTHTIMIDDVRLFGTIQFDFVELDDVIEKIKEINPDYVITFENGYTFNDVLVAYIP